MIFLKNSALRDSGLEVVRRDLHGVGLTEQLGTWSFGILAIPVEMDLVQNSDLDSGTIFHAAVIKGVLYAREVNPHTININLICHLTYIF